MAFKDKILSALGLVSKKELEAVKAELKNIPGWLGETADAEKYNIPDPYIYATQSDLYRLSPDLGMAIDKVGRDFGLSRLNVKRMVGEDERDIPNHPFELLWRNPNPLHSGVEFGQSLLSSYLLNGNAIIWLNRANEYENPQELWYIPYEMIEPVPDGRMFLNGYNFYPGMGKEPLLLPVWQVVHVKTYNPHSYFMGLSPLESLGDTIMGNLGMRGTKRKQYTEFGGAPQSILASKDWVNDEAWNEFNAKVRKAAQENSILTLRGVGEQLTWMQRALSSKDAEFTQNLEADMKTILNRIAPGLLQMISADATEATALAARATYSETLWSFLEVFAQKLTGKPVDGYGRKLVVEFEDPRVVDRRLELEEQDQYGKTHTIEELRAKYYQDDPLGDERDKLLVSEIRVKASAPGFSGNEGDQGADEDANTDQDEQADDVSMKAALDELRAWRMIALRGKKSKAANFESFIIPNDIMDGIKARLAKTDNKSVIAQIFDTAMAGLETKPERSAAHILKGIELGVKALEMRR